MKIFLRILLVLCVLVSPPVLADDPQLRAENAITEIIFEYDANDFVTYSVEPSGFVEVTFARNTPNDLYKEMVSNMRGNPNINGLLPGKTGDSCPRFR